SHLARRHRLSFPTRRSSDLISTSSSSSARSSFHHTRCRISGNVAGVARGGGIPRASAEHRCVCPTTNAGITRHLYSALARGMPRSEEHTSELQSRENLVCRL